MFEVIAQLVVVAILALLTAVVANWIRRWFREEPFVLREELKTPGLWQGMLLIVASLILTIWGRQVAIVIVEPATSQYDFEASPVCWTIPGQSDCKERGCAFGPVGQSPYHVVDGQRSMAVQVALDGSPEGRAEGRHQGEVFVNIERCLPRGTSREIPVDLLGVTITAWVTIPDTERDLLSRTRETHPGFLQLFLETCGRKPAKLLDADEFEEVKDTGAYKLTFVSYEPDAASVCRLGIKMGLNDLDGGTYEGTIYVDAVGWPRIQPLQIILLVLALAVVATAIYTRLRGRLPGRGSAPA